MYANTYAHIHAHAAAILMPIDYFISSLIATMAHYPLQDFGPQASSPSQDFGPQADWHHQYADRVGVNGFPLEEVLPPDPTAADIQAVLELWDVPRDAYPKAGQVDVNYILEKKGHKQRIHVFLRRQAFVTTPKHRQHSYFSFFQCDEYELGPVPDVHNGIGKKVMHEGYNHCTATLAWGEAMLLAGWVDEAFAVDWHNHFHSTRECEKQPIPPMLEEFILIQWPSMQELGRIHSSNAAHNLGAKALGHAACWCGHAACWKCSIADVDDTKPLQQEPDGEPDGAAVAVCGVVQPASDDFADWQYVGLDGPDGEPQVHLEDAQDGEEVDGEDAPPASSHGSYSDQEFMGPNAEWKCVFWKP